MQILDSHSVLLKEPQSILGHLSEKSSGLMAQKFSFSKVSASVKLNFCFIILKGKRFVSTLYEKGCYEVLGRVLGILHSGKPNEAPRQR